MLNILDTDVKNNLAHVRPYLGILLVGSFALGLALIINNAVTQLTQTIHATAPEGIEGSITIKNKGDIFYGDTVSYSSSASGLFSRPSNTYTTTVCFQGDSMVFQRSAQQGVSIYLYDQGGSGLKWDGGPASCSVTLMYREMNVDTVDVYVVDSVSFEVKGQPY